VGVVDKDHFQASDVHLLAAYAAACALAGRAETELLAIDGAPHARWLAAWEKATRAMANLALRLRISPQARRERAMKPRVLSWGERMALERQSQERQR
jgi:hypothetical protein